MRDRRCQWNGACYKPDGLYDFGYPQPDYGSGGRDPGFV